jgi:type IV secretory pathway TraG/TraD family ATPase VirD4
VARTVKCRQIEESRENYSYGANSIRDGISLGNQRVTRPIISYPQIMELNDLTCFLRLPGDYPITQLRLELLPRTTNDRGFIERTLPPSFDKSSLYTDTGEHDSDGAQGNHSGDEMPSKYSGKKKENQLLMEESCIEPL